MEKNIYELLNEVETDFTEYEETELSSKEKERHKQRILMEVKRMNRHKAEKENRKGKIWKKVAAAAAACAVTVGVAGLANPVLAKELFSDVFGRLIENAQGEKYEEEDTEKFTKIGKNAVSVQEEVDKHQGEEGFVTTTENNGVTLSVSDIYCDGYVLYFTTVLATENEGLNQADGIVIDMEKGMSGGVAIDGTDLAGYSTRAFEKSADGSFVAVHQIDLMNPADANENDIDLGLNDKETLVVDWNVEDLTGYLWDAWDEQGEYQSTGTVTGDWRLRFPVTIDKSTNEVFDINKEENGVVVKRGIKTKAGLVLEVELPDFTKEPYNDSYNDPNLAIKDSAGNYLQWINQTSNMHEDKTSEQQIMVLYDGEKDLSFEVTTRNKDEDKIADITFQVP